jgi:NAD(P)-dependent dehydrogenase (short-subunit alcohol dehydrogenase family)
VDVANLAGKTVVVTGAASGIGRATALAFADRGADLAICDVNEPGLAEVGAEIERRGRRALTARVDVGKLEEMQAFAARVHEGVEATDIVVANAGVGLGAGFLETSIEDWRWIVDINLWGVIYTCHSFLPRMVARGRGGHVVIVSSAAGYLATEALVAYSTTKFAVFGLAEALRDEVHHRGIGVTAVCPGIINTPITGSARLRGRQADPRAREMMIEFYRKRNYGPEKVAAGIVKAVARDAAVAPVSPEAWAMYLLKRLSPSLVARFNRRLAARVERDLAKRGIVQAP